MFIEESVLGVVFDIYGGEDDNNICGDRWESYLWLYRSVFIDNMIDIFLVF